MKRLWALMGMLALLACALAGCGAEQAPSGETRVLLDGAEWAGESLSPDDGGLRVVVTLDGAPLADLPFDEAHTLTVLQPDGGENTVAVTGEAVYMESANCENQDCVHMGEVTRDNLELRVLGGFIVCLPHRLSVEVRGD